jgi:hypothetical protein
VVVLLIKRGRSAKWILETEAFGFGLRGSPTDDNSEEGRLPHLTRVSDSAMLQRIIRQEGLAEILRHDVSFFNIHGKNFVALRMNLSKIH